ncbi:MAG TPA: NAD(P)-binding domain-containing protein [Nocardioidaceae bacterium]|nr:NAD(P)-binding domain-containing protein [Nocardioidaceae bacterium]
MRIAVLGTGMVGQALAGRLSELGHDVAVGTRDPAATMARDEPDQRGGLPFAAWMAGQDAVRLMTFADAAEHGELIINASSGTASLRVLEAAGAGGLAGSIVLDLANPLDYSRGFLELSVVNTDSLAEQIQRAYPDARVVKSLNTVNCQVMVDPARVPGEHVVFVASDDEAAKATVVDLLGELGWPPERVVDLGGLSAARATEMYLPLWVTLMQRLGSADFNIALERAQ